MNWIDVVWPMMAGASFMLALIHVLIWLKQGQQTSQLMFALTAIAVAVIAIFEQLAMHAPTTDSYATILRWAHVPFAVMMVGIVSFVRLQLQAGRLWLAVAVGGGRVLSLVPDFLTGVNLNFKEITGLRRITVWGGDSIVAPIGAPNPWMALGQFTLVLLMVFLLDAIVTSWRHDNPERRRRLTLICGSMLVFVVFSSLWALGVVSGSLHAPITVNPAFVLVLLAMSYDLGGDILRAAQLARSLSVSQSHLRDTEQRMALAVEAARIGLWNWDIANSEFWLSESGLRLLGFAPGQKVDREHFLEHAHPADRRNLRDALAKAAQAQGEYSSEYRIVNVQGHTRWIVARGQVEFAENGTPLRLRGVIVDITKRKEAEERFRLVVETSPLAKVMVDERGLITLVNRQAEVVFGYSREELVGMNVDALVPLRYRRGHAVERTAYATGATARAMGAGRELFGRRKDGSEVPVEIGLSPIHSDQGLFVLAAIADISERKRSDRELAMQRDELAHLSRVVLLSELSGSLAHELNQPLTAVLSNAQAALRFLAHTPPNFEEVHDSLTNIVENDKRAGEVIRRLRAMLRKDRADHRLLDINDVVLDVLRLIRSDLVNRNVEIVLDLGADLPVVEGDRVQLQQVLLNLVMNGTDAMTDVVEDRTITVRTRSSDAGGVLVSVADAGRGIPADDLKRIFSPFVTSKTSGIGLGLAVCTSIIQTHRGRIWATNNSPSGASVHFSLPVSGDPSDPLPTDGAAGRN
jgi:PAS domain S-box-containing protein